MWKMGFCVTNSFRLHHSLGVESASDKNQCQMYVLFGKVGRCLKLSSLLPCYAGSLEILRASNSCSPHGLCKPVWVCFVSVVNAKLHDSESLITGLVGFQEVLQLHWSFFRTCVSTNEELCEVQYYYCHKSLLSHNWLKRFT
jgi:hypothetical protein